MNGASATISISDTSKIYDSNKKGHAEMIGLNDMAKDMNGKDVVISDVTGHFPYKVEKPVGMCVNCRTDMFDVLDKAGAKSVTIPITKSNQVIGTVTIPRENFVKVQAELNNVRSTVKGNRQRSDAAWKVLSDNGTVKHLH